MTSKHDGHYDANRARWDESVAIHAASEGYDMAGFIRGEKTLYQLEVDEVGDVAGKSLLHLQCHFGMDTLNWARLGATVTGIDFAESAVVQARELAQTIGIADARFIQSNVYDANEALPEQFDIVYTGIGALCWLHDIRGWAKVVRRFLKPGGFVYLYEGHPTLWGLDDDRTDGDLVLRHPYFETTGPLALDSAATYVDGAPLKNTRSFQWNHGIGEVVTALLEAGLRLDLLHEHREVAWQALTWMENVDAMTAKRGYQRRTQWRLPPAQRDLLPLMYSLKATRPDSST
jgi:SAM-dependent methyltransferase